MKSQNLDVLLDIELPVTVRLGCTQMTFADVMNLNSGSLVEFGRTPEDPVEVLVEGISQSQVHVAAGLDFPRIKRHRSTGQQNVMDVGCKFRVSGNGMRVLRVIFPAHRCPGANGQCRRNKSHIVCHRDGKDRLG